MEKEIAESSLRGKVLLGYLLSLGIVLFLVSDYYLSGLDIHNTEAAEYTLSNVLLYQSVMYTLALPAQVYIFFYWAIKVGYLGAKQNRLPPRGVGYPFKLRIYRGRWVAYVSVLMTFALVFMGTLQIQIYWLNIQGTFAALGTFK